jgi:N-acetylneuraminic acid mutarotase
MKKIIILTIATFIFFSCKKTKDVVPSPTPVPVVVAPTVQEINTVVKIDINEFDIGYTVYPQPGETFSDVCLQWSTSQDYSSGKDSVVVTVTGALPATYHLKGLKQDTRYYGRVGLTYKGIRFYSASKQWKTDSLKIISVGYLTPAGLNKVDSTIAFTNLANSAAVTGSKIFLGTYECPVVSDQGLSVQFSVPSFVPAGKYIFKLLTRGMESQAADSVEVLRGRWSMIGSPAIPVNPLATASGLYDFATCYSGQKGYMLGGAYSNGPAVPYPNSQYPEFIFEFNGATNNWTKRYPNTLHYYQNPICYYYNNGIYVIGALEHVLDGFGNNHAVILKKVMRLDLGTLNWSVVNDVPYPTIYNLTSFELNNEWYIGMGSDSADRSICCSDPLPAKKFWKYSPTGNQWTQLASFPGGHQTFPTCFSVGSKGYAFYGAVPVGNPDITTTFTRELWEYDPVTNIWTAKPLPATSLLPAGEKYQIISYNGKAYFLTGQVRTLFGTGYGFYGVNPCVEWNPATGVFSRISYSYNSNIMHAFFKQGNNFYFQSDALGYWESIPNKTYKLTLE